MDRRSSESVTIRLYIIYGHMPPPTPTGRCCAVDGFIWNQMRDGWRAALWKPTGVVIDGVISV